jgi:hypothetical protein
MMKIEGSGSISQRHGSADPDPDPHKNVMDPEHCLRVEKKKPSERAARDQQLKNLSEEQRDFLEKRARMRRQQSGGR